MLVRGPVSPLALDGTPYDGESLIIPEWVQETVAVAMVAGTDLPMGLTG